MKITCNLFLALLLAFILGSCNGSSSVEEKKDYPISPVSFVNVKFTDNFWAPRIKINQEVTIPIALKHCYNTGRVDNFRKAGGLIPGCFATDLPFDDTDIYKIIEGMSYSVQMYPNHELDSQMDTLIYYISKAQEPDGYLFTARTAAEPGKLHSWVGEKRWEKDPDLSHELYNAGHLYEAAVAHYQATGKRSLLDIAVKNADLLVKDFGPGKLAYEPGHQIVEMGLAKLYRVTGRQEYLDLAKYFLDLKGNGERGEYCQSHKPVTEQDEAVGHAVRAVYMYSGMADVAALTGNEAYLTAIDKIWENVVNKKYYITGGIGATAHGEAFGKNYELPNMSAYCETCAAIGNVYWNHRLFLLHGDSKYYDVIERTLYNGLISGVSLSGDHFFYPNPLESEGQHRRSEWFGCACCPSNVCRFMPSVPGYVYAQRDDKIYVNLFVASNSEIKLKENTIRLSQQSDYPWNGNISITVDPDESQKFDILVRIPGWAQNKPVPGDLYAYLNSNEDKTELKVNGKSIDYTLGKDGYAAISRKWKKGDIIEISLPMKVHRTIANENVMADKGKVSLERGPVVYCLEWVDNNDRVLNAVLADDVAVTDNFRKDELNGIVRLEMEGKSTSRDIDNNIKEEDKHLTAIPYYAWANRGAGEMVVWIPRTAGSARPVPPVTICTTAKITASKDNKSLKAINDGYWPTNSNDREYSFYSLWPEKGTKEWVMYEFQKPESISQASVYWYDDRPWGGCRIPQSWAIEYKDRTGIWKPVKNITEYKTGQDIVNTVSFETITTKYIRLTFQLMEKESAGVYEFEVK